jgi:hypothetical protein
MREVPAHPGRGLSTRRNQPLIGVPVKEGDEEVVRYFSDEHEADRALARDSIQRALSLAGAWEALDSDDALDELDRIRHQSTPTPPLEHL